MGLIAGLLTLPLAPLRGVVWIAEQIHDEAQRQWFDPDVIQEQLADVEEQRAAGLIGEDEAAAVEEQLVQRLLEGGGYG